MNITIDSKFLYAMAVTSPFKDYRFYINGVCIAIKNNNVTLKATDGHSAIAINLGVFTTDLPDGEWIIASNFIKQINKAKVQGPVLIEIEGNIVSANATFSDNVIDGKFPDLARVFPRSISNVVAQFDPLFVSKFYKIGEILNDVPYVHHNGDNTALVTFKSNNIIGCILPLNRASFSYDKVPDWL